MSIFSEQFEASDVFRFTKISARTKSHLSEVYQLLACLIGSCAAGVALNIKYGYGNGGTSFLGFMLLIYVSLSSEKSIGRLSALLGFGLLQGMSLGGLIELSLFIDPSILVTALLSTFGVFVSFSLAALWSDRRHSLYLSGFLMTALNILCLMSLAALFGFGTSLFFNVNLYLGLFIMAGFVFVDTQIMINRCENNGEFDSYKDSLMMFIDAVGIFVRILIILMKNSDKKKDRD
jgi:hypothetical protein